MPADMCEKEKEMVVSCALLLLRCRIDCTESFRPSEALQNSELHFSFTFFTAASS